MMTNAARGLAAALTLLALTATPAHAAPDPAPQTVPLRQAVTSLPVADESRAGYERSKFRHWIDEDGDGCSTRVEALFDEAVGKKADATCKDLTGDSWYSYYDDTWVSDPRGLDIDHMVPLAEAWDSGASAWTPARRQAYANDLGAERSLVAVTARSNRSKSDQDPAEWMPPAAGATCRYLEDWTATKLRWSLTVDTTEQQKLADLAAGCPDEPITYTVAE